MRENKTALTKGVKVRNIILLAVASFFLLLSIGGILNIRAQGRYEVSNYIVNLVIIPIAALLVLRTSLVLSGKAKPITIPVVFMRNLVSVIVMGFCCIFMTGFFIYGIAEGDGGIIRIAGIMLLLYSAGFFFWIRKIVRKEPEKTEEPIRMQQESARPKFQVEYLDDVTFIQQIECTPVGAWRQYDVLLAARGYGWEMMRDWADYMVQADLEGISVVNAGSMGEAVRDFTESYRAHGRECKQTPELEREYGYLAIGGLSPTLLAPVKIVWYNQTRVLRLFAPIEDADKMACYVETMVRRTFGTENAMKLGRPLPEKPAEKKEPVTIQDGAVYIDSQGFFDWKKDNPQVPQYEKCGVIALTTKEPVITLYDDGTKVREYCLQTKDDEDFTGKYFLISVRVGIQGNPPVPMAQIDGFISDTQEERKITLGDIGYRMEGYFLSCAGAKAQTYYARMRGHDLPVKGLKYPGYTTPSNIRLVGICPECGKSFCFHGYAFYMAQSDVAYSDDGMDCCEIQEYQLDKDTWSYEEDGKTFRYYNSFCCIHCGEPYIDYKRYPEEKAFGVSGCVHLGRKIYRTRC